jgi:hypothetical protein
MLRSTKLCTYIASRTCASTPDRRQKCTRLHGVTSQRIRETCRDLYAAPLRVFRARSPRQPFGPSAHQEHKLTSNAPQTLDSSRGCSLKRTLVPCERRRALAHVDALPFQLHMFSQICLASKYDTIHFMVKTRASRRRHSYEQRYLCWQVSMSHNCRCGNLKPYSGAIPVTSRASHDAQTIGCQPHTPAALQCPETLLFCFWYSFVRGGVNPGA